MAGGAVAELIRRARRRWVRNLILAQGTEAACVAAGGFILLLLAGAQALDGRWLVALAAASLLWAWRRMLRQIPSPYQVAQAMDRNLGLEDWLSTAFFLGRMGPERKVSEGMRQAQLAAAERLCRQVDVRRAVPLRAPRALYVAAVLTVAAGGLFALRYGIVRRLELRRSLPKIVLDTLRPPVRHQARGGRRADQPLEEHWHYFGMAVDQYAGGGQEGAGPTATGDARHSQRPPEGAQPLQVSLGGEDRGQLGDDVPGDRLSVGAGSEEGPQQGAQSRQKSSLPGASDSLLDKFRDALSNLLNRLKIQPKGGASEQLAASAQAESAEGRQALAQRGMPGSGRQLSEGSPGSEAQDSEATEGAPKSSRAPGRRGGEETGTEASREGRSGIGREEGDKGLRQAEQLAAMGKISEIFGRRSQSLTGEVTVEVTSGKQQLRTAYSQQQAAHAEAGGAIHRDEIPLAYQSYVARYFEEVRKLAPEGTRPRK
jgi:hypothetical protein